MRARIDGVAKQMESFDFLFGAELRRKVLNMAGNLSMVLQGSTVSASEGQTLMQMTINALESIRSDDSFTLFWGLVRQRQREHGVDEAKLPRQRNVPRRLEVGSSVPEGHRSAEDLYRRTYYFEVIDYVLEAICSRFNQRGYGILCKLEALLCDAEVDLGSFDDVFTLYGNDFNAECLATQLHVLHSNLPMQVKMRRVV